jgi:hypothetical protein
MSRIIYNYNYDVNYADTIDIHNEKDAYKLMLNESLYREQMMEVFRLDKKGAFLDNVVNDQIELIYPICKRNLDMREIIEFSAQNHPLRGIIGTDDVLVVGFMVLFSYDYFYLTHRCIREILTEHFMPRVVLTYPEDGSEEESPTETSPREIVLVNSGAGAGAGEDDSLTSSTLPTISPFEQLLGCLKATMS